MPRTSKAAQLMMQLGDEHLNPDMQAQIRGEIMSTRKLFLSCLDLAKQKEDRYDDEDPIAEGLCRLLFGDTIQAYGRAIFSSPAKEALWEESVMTEFWKVQMLVGLDSAQDIYGDYETDHHLPVSLTFLFRRGSNPVCRDLFESLREAFEDDEPMASSEQSRIIKQVLGYFDLGHPTHRSRCVDCQQIISDARKGIL